MRSTWGAGDLNDQTVLRPEVVGSNPTGPTTIASECRSTIGSLFSDVICKFFDTSDNLEKRQNPKSVLYKPVRVKEIIGLEMHVVGGFSRLPIL